MNNPDNSLPGILRTHACPALHGGRMSLHPFVLMMICGAVAITGCGSHEQNKLTDMKYPGIPLLRATNEVVAFDSLTGQNVTQSETITMQNANVLLDRIISVEEPDFENSMRPLDRVINMIKRMVFPLDVLVEVHPDSAVRAACVKSEQNLKNYSNALFANEKLFAVAKKYSGTDEAKNLTGFKKKFLSDLMLQFKRGGMELDEEHRKKLNGLRTKIDELGTKYSINIAKNDHFLEITEADTAGLDASYLESRKTEKGTYKIDLSYPSLRPFMRYCKSESQRKAIWRLFQNRAYPDNEALLDSILLYRQELAKMLGYNTYAEYSFAVTMAGTTKTVWDFENSLVAMIKPKAEKELQELMKVKSEYQGKPAAEFFEWEVSFYENIQKQKEYKLDDRQLREYFELNSVIGGLFQITQKLLGLRYEEVTNPHVWHPEVKMYNCFDAATNNLIGRFYLDLFPRKDKYSHAAMFTITPGRLMENGEKEIPEAALVCNFSKAEGDKPSLLYHGEVETFFHEFGHLLHGMTALAEFAYQSGPEACMLDFVEAPSQIWENWAYDKASLDLFAKHYKTGDSIPDELVNKLIAQKQLNSGLDAVRQLCFGVFALTLHDKYIPFRGESITSVSHRLRKEIYGFQPLEDDHFETSFGHLVGYDAGYYAYMWSKVYAQDMWSVFEEKGPLNPEIGLQYRQKVLSPGGSAHPLDCVRNFLGREPNNKAMLKDLGLTVK